MTVPSFVSDLNAISAEWGNGAGAGELSQDDNQIGFSGYLFNSETQQYHVRFRCYDTNLGRWLQRDPAGYVDGANLYGYARGNPIGAMDPYGLNRVGAGGGGGDGNIMDDEFVVGEVGNPWVDHWIEHFKTDRTGRFKWHTPGLWTRFWGGTGGAIVEGFVRGLAIGIGAAFILAELPFLIPVAIAVGVVSILNIVDNWDSYTDEEKAEIIAELIGILIGGGVSGGARGGRVRGRPHECFTTGTLVLSAIGLVAIESVAVGDEVWSVSVETGELELSKVTEVFVTENQFVFELTYTDALGERTTLEVTPEHPFWTLSEGWVAVADLELGAFLHAANGEFVVVTGLRPAFEPRTVYNLEVEGTHTYLVGDDAVWVHNVCRNRFIKELHKRDYIFIRPTRTPGGRIYRGPNGGRFRIMPRPAGRPFRGEPIEKFIAPYYYRYYPPNGPKGPPVPLSPGVPFNPNCIP